MALSDEEIRRNLHRDLDHAVAEAYAGAPPPLKMPRSRTVGSWS